MKLNRARSIGVGAVVASVGLMAFAATSAVALSGHSDQTSPSVKSRSTVVRTTSGKVVGISQTAYDAWLGIPYAANPAGQQRWTAPQPVTPWTGVRNATQFSERCAQASGIDPGYENTFTT